MPAKLHDISREISILAVFPRRCGGVVRFYAEAITPPLAHAKSINSARFSPDGRRVLTASNDGAAQVWDAQTDRPLLPPLEHRGQVTVAEFSPDGDYILTISSNNGARLWNAQIGQLARGPWKPDPAAVSAQFSPKAEYLATASTGTARVWDFRTGQEISRIAVEPAPFPSSNSARMNRAETIREIREHLNRQPDSGDGVLWGRWLLADPSPRTASPFSGPQWSILYFKRWRFCLHPGVLREASRRPDAKYYESFGFNSGPKSRRSFDFWTKSTRVTCAVTYTALEWRCQSQART